MPEAVLKLHLKVFKERTGQCQIPVAWRGTWAAVWELFAWGVRSASRFWPLGGTEPWWALLVRLCPGPVTCGTVPALLAAAARDHERLLSSPGWRVTTNPLAVVVSVDWGASRTHPKFTCLQKGVQEDGVSSVCTLSSKPAHSHVGCTGLIPAGFNPGAGLQVRLRQKEATVEKVLLVGGVAAVLLWAGSRQAGLHAACSTSSRSAGGPADEWRTANCWSFGNKRWPRSGHWVVMRSIRFSEALWHCRVLNFTDMPSNVP